MLRIIKAFDARDVIGLGGFGILVYGVWMIHHAAAVIVAGALMLIFAIISARK